jgi:membrane protein YqaA with SNARE-associated domain
MRHAEAMNFLLASSHGSNGIWNHVLHWLHHLGGPGLILLGIVDSSLLPVPGSLDALTIVLAANQHQWWPYYAAMATLGSLIGGYLTYRLAGKEGKAKLEKRLSQDKVRKIENIVDRWGFGAIAIVALLPPPAPMVPFLLAAGAAQYSRNKFLGALALGRGIRYTVLAFLAARYGGTLLRLISHHGHVIIILIAISVAAGVGAFLFFRFHKKKRGKKRK